MDLTILIVHFDNIPGLLNLLKSIYKGKSKIKFEVVVVDNDEKNIKKLLTKDFPKIKYLKSIKNLGFGGGVNFGVKKTSGKNILVLNPDTDINQLSIKIMYDYLDSGKDTAIVSPTLTNQDGSIASVQGSMSLGLLEGFVIHSFLDKLFPNNPISRSFFLRDRNLKIIQEIAVAPGCCFMIKREVFEKVGGFDENFFLYFEESDLCRRIRDLGYKLIYLPEAKVVHIQGGSTKNSKDAKNIYEESKYYYFKKYYGNFWAFLVTRFTQLSPYYLLFAVVFVAVVVLIFV